MFYAINYPSVSVFLLNAEIGFHTLGTPRRRVWPVTRTTRHDWFRNAFHRCSLHINQENRTIASGASGVRRRTQLNDREYLKVCVRARGS